MKPKKKCNHIFKYGKNKNNRCENMCFGSYCNKHNKKTDNNLKNYTVVELKEKCKSLKIKGYSKLKKIELIKLLENNSNI